MGRLRTASRASSMAEPRADRLRMRPQSFRIRQRLDDRRNLSQARPRKFLDADELYEIENAEPAPEAGSTTRGQDVTGTRSVVTRSLWRIGAYENRTGITDKRNVRRVNRDVFRCQFVRPLKALATRGGYENDAVPEQRLARHRIPAA